MSDMLIMAPDEFVAELTPLQVFKQSAGIKTDIITLNTIEHTYQGRDIAEKVKRCLESAVRNTGTRYAMLVGGNSKFPVRYTKGEHKDPRSFNTGYGPADLYYADLFEQDGTFDDWDRNKNGSFGELRGEVTAGTLNVDDVDLRPDVAVGRVPAATAAEVRRYVNKVIRFESGPIGLWTREALLVATTDWVSDACKTQDLIASQYLKGYHVQRLYAQPSPCGATAAPTRAAVSTALNKGVAFVSYMGHGSPGSWGGSLFTLTDVAALTNKDRLPVVFAAACDTSWFAKQPPYDSYVDVQGIAHRGVNQGEVFAAPPPAPACLQPGPDVNSMGVHFLVEGDSGAIGHLGCITGAQPYSIDLGRYFFEAVSQGITTLGDMWRHMLTRYYEVHVPPLAVSPPDWTKVAEFHQPWKFFLFGDPSLRLRRAAPVKDACQPIEARLEGAKRQISIAQHQLSRHLSEEQAADWENRLAEAVHEAHEAEQALAKCRLEHPR